MAKEIKARKAKNINKRKCYDHSHFTNETFLSNSGYMPIQTYPDQNNSFSIDWNIVGGVALIAVGIGIEIYIVLNDITIIGILDDIPGLVVAWAVITNGRQMIFG